MHELHLVGFTADHDGLIFSTKKGATSGAYVVGIDDALFAALEEARRMAMAEPDDAAARAAADRVRALRPTQRSNLSVRDIQSRLRAGMTLAQVAAEAGVDEDWVARFAAPVLAEQAAVVERAMAFSFTTTRKGSSSRPLGEAVRWNLTDKGISVDTSPQGPGWSAFQLEPGQWALRFTYTSRGRLQVAEWEVDLDAGELSGRNRLASELAYVEAGARRRKPVEVVAPPPPPPPKKATSGRKGTPARTKTARAEAARATSKKAAAARAKAKAPTASTPSERAKAGGAAKQGAARSGAGESSKRGSTPAESRRRAVPPPPEATPPKRPTVGRPGITAASSDAGGGGGGKAPPGGLARFPAPRPAAGRPPGQGAAPAKPAPSMNRQPAPRPAPRPAPPATGSPQPQPPPQPAPRSAPAAAAPQPAPKPAPQPMGTRRVAPPSRPSPLAPTADAKPMPTVHPGDGPAPPPASTVRRLPAPSPAAASRRADRQPPAPVIELKPEPPTLPPEPQPTPPRGPATVRPVGGSDGRPTILIIDADRAGDRKRS